MIFENFFRLQDKNDELQCVAVFCVCCSVLQCVAVRCLAAGARHDPRRDVQPLGNAL